MQIASSFFSLPPYAPQYNPDELLNNTLKKTIHVDKLSTNLIELHTHVYSKLMSLQKSPATISSFFDAPKTQYAR
jgi:hypothetical protein